MKQSPIKVQDPKIIELKPKILAGLSVKMSLADNRTAALWRQTRPLLSNLPNRIGNAFFSLQIYPPGFSFSSFSPQTSFTKWALAEILPGSSVPEPLQKFSLEGGLYAVFIHKGLPSDFPKTAAYIYGKWLPGSSFILDNRPHFEVLGPDYHPHSPDSEEQIWIPIKKK